MTKKKLTPMEIEVMQQFWQLGATSIRDIQETLPENRQVEYTTVQTIVYRLEKKGAVRRTRKIGNAHIFEAVWSKKSAVGSFVDDFLSLFGGSAEPVMSHLIESGKLSLEDIRLMENALKEKEAEEEK